MSSRRAGGKPSKESKFEELRRLRAQGKTRLDTYEVEEEEELYDEVDEEGYKSLVRKRLEEDDFVVDDQGEGYVDYGIDDWDERRREFSESEEEADPASKRNTKSAKRKREEEEKKKKEQAGNITKFFNAAAANSTKPKPRNTAEDAAFLADILGDFEDAPAPAPSRPKRTAEEPARKTRRLSPPSRPAKLTSRPNGKSTESNSHSNVLPSSPGPVLPKLEDDDLDGGLENDFHMSDAIPAPSSPTTKYAKDPKPSAVSIKVEEDDDDDVVMAEIDDSGISGEMVNYSAARPALVKSEPVVIKPEVKAVAPEVDISAWKELNSKLTASTPQVESVSHGKLHSKDAVEEDGSLNFFWIDYTEINGALCLFGKVLAKDSGKYVSCFVKVDGIKRNMYFLPREHRMKNGRETDEEVDFTDVFEEVRSIMSKHNIKKFASKVSTRKYAFELPDIPQQSDYLKVLYDYTSPALPMDLKGETFSHIFGTNTALFEQFVLCRNIMGPCWLKLQNCDFTAVQNASWCKFELQISNPFDITPLADSDPVSEPPPFTVMSIAMRTDLNVKDNKQEIVSITARVYENVSLIDPVPAKALPSRVFTVIRPVDRIFPPGFEAAAKNQLGSIKLEKTESALLNYFLAKIQLIDPDALVGHQLENIDYGILLHRMRELKTNGWHRIGRMRRSEWPKSHGRMAGTFFSERSLVAGRLICDLANDMGKSLMMQCQSWSLTEMCELMLGEKRTDVDSMIAFKTWAKTSNGLVDFLIHAELDTYFIAALAIRTQLLPLTKQLTNLAGNSWARTLSGTRAERNEYILLHEFHRNKYICPDKTWGKSKATVQKENDEEDGEEVATTSKKKDKYKGGLVFEPEKGLYDKFILVMDFNSLYPSIIQEYNICFTTVARNDLEEDKVPDAPDGSVAKGILPKLIATLVDRRAEVKKLMKRKDATATQKAQWDTKQQALKLTANSMYGCLGYDRSRFYAKPLAMLTTFKGREILRHTKEMAEGEGLQVVYGDTDSVMINTGKTNYAEAIQIGNKFKLAVNEQYKKLEIDIDNVFQRLLLHAKKKYAAMNLVEINGKLESKMEVKGLDMRRREYCALSKDASAKILEFIFSGEERETIVEKIHDYLRELSAKVRGNEIPAGKFIILTKLGKNPEDYHPNGKTMPQVQVALRKKARGEVVKVNDVISYIITEGASSNPAERAYAPQDVLKADSGMKPDFEWYLVKQLFPPIERLCAPIDGTDSTRLAECLGLDTRKYQISHTVASVEKDLQPLESTIPDEERFRDAKRLSITCRFCKNSFEFTGLIGSESTCNASGIHCQNPDCGKPISVISLVAQLEHQIRAVTSKYYDAWLQCSDSTCDVRTRQITVYGKRCIGPKGLAKGCRGVMSYEYTDKALYNQLLYFQSIFDVDKAIKNAPANKQQAIKSLATLNRVRFTVAKNVVDKYLEKNGRRWVSTENLFRFCIPAA